MFTTRTDRLVSIFSFVVSLWLVLALASLLGAIGPGELAIAVVIAIPITIVVSRRLRTALARRNRPA